MPTGETLKPLPECWADWEARGTATGGTVSSATSRQLHQLALFGAHSVLAEPCPQPTVRRPVGLRSDVDRREG